MPICETDEFGVGGSAKKERDPEWPELTEPGRPRNHTPTYNVTVVLCHYSLSLAKFQTAQFHSAFGDSVEWSQNLGIDRVRRP